MPAVLTPDRVLAVSSLWALLAVAAGGLAAVAMALERVVEALLVELPGLWEGASFLAVGLPDLKLAIAKSRLAWAVFSVITKRGALTGPSDSGGVRVPLGGAALAKSLLVWEGGSEALGTVGRPRVGLPPGVGEGAALDALAAAGEGAGLAEAV